jgi:hypothetical protein
VSGALAFHVARSLLGSCRRMGISALRLRWAGVAAIAAGALLAASAAIAASSVTKHFIGFFKVPAGQTRMLSIPYPDALEYGNATYSGRDIVRAVKFGPKLRAPDLTKVRILYAGSVQGGSSFEVRAHNANAAGTAAVRVEVIATTVEQLPHS